MKLHFRQLMVAVALLASGISNAAQVYRYVYTGAPEYELVLPGTPAELRSISGFIDLAQPLTTNFSGIVDPLAFSFTDGITTITENSGYLNTLFEFHTDAQGDIEDWWVYMENWSALPGENYVLSTTSRDEQTMYCGLECDQETDFGAFTSYFQKAGIASPYWTVSVIPIPAAVWLFGSGLGLLGWLRRRQAA